MSKMGDKVLMVQDLLIDYPDMDLEDIAKMAGVSVDFVQDVYPTVEPYMGPMEPEYDGQPDEAQEWHDYDPDC
jgi:hypothetical protein